LKSVGEVEEVATEAGTYQTFTYDEYDFRESIVDAIEGEDTPPRSSLEDAVDRLIQEVEDWRDGGSYTDSAATTERKFKEALGLEGDVRNGSLDAGSTSESDRIVAATVAGVTREFLRDRLSNEDGTVDAARGLQQRGTGDVVLDMLEDPERDSFGLQTNATSNYSTTTEGAYNFAEHGTYLDTAVDPSEVALANTALF
jgi:hypothetical protein